MSLYWYSIQNLGMGYYVLEATGSGGFQIGGVAITSYKIRVIPPRIIITEQTPDLTTGLLHKYDDVVRAIARLQNIVPNPNPPPGSIVVSSGDTTRRFTDEQIQKTNNAIARLTAMLPNAAEPDTGYVIVENVVIDTVSPTIEAAKKKFAANADKIKRLENALLVARSRT